jgi:hypothetical protein
MLEIKQTRGQRVVHHSRKASPMLRAVRNVIVTMVILMGLFVGGGVVYTWYNGKYGEPPKVTATLKKPVPSRSPSKPSPTGRVGASVQMITSPIAPGDNASITVKTNADAKCTIVVEYNKVVAKDSGLVQKVADDYGLVTWAWSVPVTAPAGKWPVTVLCANLKFSGQVIGDLVIKKA